jgi:organic hydroperoxide reductase OsmC/OhrA
MQPFPHRYEVEASASDKGEIILRSNQLQPLASAAPAEFGGPGNRWSPETLLVAAVADCFVLTFRGIAANSQLSWSAITCEAAGTVERIDYGVTRFTEVAMRARLTLGEGMDEAKARRVLEKAERTCLIGNSLNAPVHLESEILIECAAA